MLVNISQAKEEDLDWLEQAFMQYREELEFQSSSNTLNAYLKRLVSEQYVAIARLPDESNLVIGFVICERASSSSLVGERLELVDLWVTPRCRSNGVGHELINWVKRSAATQGFLCIDLVSHVENVQAHRFYERHGFSAMALRAFRFKPD